MTVRWQIAPLGPDGVRQRVEELRARIAQLSAAHEPQPVALHGQIGNAPFDPLSAAAKLSPAQLTEDVREIIRGAADEHQLDPALLEAVVAAESGFDPLARSRAGAMGLTQLMPDTARALGVSNPFDPAQNVHGGAKYLATLIERFGDLKTALAAYNAGPSAVERAGGIPAYPETQRYVERVIGLYKANGGLP